MAGKKKEDISLEKYFVKLEETAEALEKEDISLEEAFRLYGEGMEMLKACNEKIDRVEKEVLKINKNGELVALDDE